MKAVSLVPSLAHLTQSNLIQALGEMELAYIFKHALVQDTAYHALLKNERRRLHHAVASSIEQTFPQQLNEHAARLAEHFWFAEEWARAADYSQRAGEAALRVFASLEAIAHFERALAALKNLDAPSPLREYDALIGWAEAAAKYRPYAEQLEKLARAEAIARADNDKPRLARVLYSLGGAHASQGHNLRAEKYLAECFTLADELGDERLTVIPTYFMGMATLTGNPRGALALFERAIELAKRYENTDIEAVTWTAKAWAYAQLGEIGKAHAAIVQGQQLLPDVKSPMMASDVDLYSGWAFLELGDAQQGLLYGQRGVEKAVAAKNFDCICGAYLCVGFNQLASQRLDKATTAFHEAIRQSQFSGAEIFETLGRAGLALAQFYDGRADETDVLEQTYAQAQAMDISLTRLFIAQALSAIYLVRGDFARAEYLLDDAAKFFRRNQMLPALAQALELLAQVYDTQGRTADAQRARTEATQSQQTVSNKINGDARGLA